MTSNASECILSLDLSTTCTGYALFSIDGQLITYGSIKPLVKNPKKKGVPQYQYPYIQVLKMRAIVEQILLLIAVHKPRYLVVEEVVSHKSRLTGKVLDGLHFVLADRLLELGIDVKYVDVSGTTGWRTKFGIRQSPADKLVNAARKKHNKQYKAKLKLIDWKTLSARYVNKRFGLQLDPDKFEEHGDVADAICVGASNF